MKLTWNQLHFASDLETDVVLSFSRTLAVRARRGLLMTAWPVICEVESNAGHLTWRIGVASAEAAQVLTSLRQAVPDLHLDAVEHQPSRFDRVWELRSSTHRRALETDHPELASTAVLLALQRAYRNERVLLQWLIGPWLPRRVVPPPSKPTNPSSLDFSQLILDSEQTTALRKKVAEPVFGVVGRLAVSAALPARRNVLRQGVMGALQLLRAPGVGLERRLLPSFLTSRRLVRYQRPIVAWPISFNARELMAALSWPIGGPNLPGVEYSGHRHLPPSSAQLLPLTQSPRTARITGRSTFPGLPGYLHLRAEDGLRGTHLVGPTGTGKSTEIAQLALQDIEAGRGIVVIDPKRDLVEAIADRIPHHRLDDVVIIDPTDSAPVGVNVLGVGQDDFVADLLVHILRELYSSNWGQRTADVIHNAVLSLTRHGGMTLCELPPLLTNKAFRQVVVERLRDDVLGVAPFWYWFDSLSEAERSTVIAPVLNKLRSFTNRKAVRGVIGQAKGFDLRTVFTERKVVLINLATGDAGSETGQLLGSLIIGAIWATIQTRSQIPPERRHPCFLYVDEFADLMRLPQDLGDALAKARGLGVGLVLAHQHLAQLNPSVKAAVGANARSRIVWQCGYEDASALAKMLGGGLTANDLQQLQKFETYQALCVNGRTLAPASALTLPLQPSLGTLAEVQRNSRDRFGVAREQTDKDLVARRRVEPPTGEVGSRRRRNS